MKEETYIYGPEDIQRLIINDLASKGIRFGSNKYSSFSIGENCEDFPKKTGEWVVKIVRKSSWFSW